jgi:RES domain-containing protein
MVYAASSLSLAILESLVNSTGSKLPPGMMYATADVPDDLARERIAIAALPADWDVAPAPPILQSLGDAWIAARRTVALMVPSAVAKIEENALLNPQHPAYAKIAFGAPQMLSIDERLRSSTGSVPRHSRAIP